MAPGAGFVGEDPGRLAVAMPGEYTWGSAGVQRLATRQLRATPEPRGDQGEGARQGLLQQLDQQLRQRPAAEFHQMAFPPEAVQAIGQGVAAEVGEPRLGLQGNAVVKEQGRLALTDPFVIPQLRMQMGHRRPGIGMDRDPVRRGESGPVAEGHPAPGWRLARRLLAIAGPPSGGAAVSITLLPAEAAAAEALAVCLLLQQGERRREHQRVGIGMQPERPGAVQCPDGIAIEAAGQQPGDGGGIRWEVLRRPTGERLG